MIYDKRAEGSKFLSPHFQVKEFASSYSHLVDIDATLINTLEQLFAKLGCSKMTINSGYRTPSHSVAVGGYSTDDHTKGIAADIKCYDSKGLIIPARVVCITAEDLGIKAIGYINANSTHISTRTSPKWFGDESTGGSFASFYTHFGIAKEQPIVQPIIIPEIKSINVGSKVVLMPYATRYATGQTIPLRYRNKLYTVKQMGNNKVLLKELMSWVLLRDVK